MTNDDDQIRLITYDNCPAISNTDQLDTDTDGAGDVCDSTPNGDDDSDTVDNLADNCPAISNTDQLDTDKMVRVMFVIARRTVMMIQIRLIT